MITFSLKTLRRGGIALSLVLLTHCGTFDTYQGDGVWRKADGSTYQAPAPLNILKVQSSWGPNMRKTIRTVENSSVNSQGQTVIQEKEATTIEVTFGLLVTLENGEQHEMSFNVSGDRNSSQYASASFIGSNGYSYNASGNVYLSSFNPTFNLSISSKGIEWWRNTITLR
ncbi:hypothetical protein N9127_01435 [Akkermansiaceae bacterium]|nr:hypothetical protein [Akkermansiaceae bacterium]